MSSAPRDPEHPDEPSLLVTDVVQLARTALGGDASFATPVVRRMARKYRRSHPELADQLVALLRATPMRQTSIAEPVDSETRLALVREEVSPLLDNEPIWSEGIAVNLRQIADEHRQATRLFAAGLSPTRTALFVGPPGVGKTLAARWLAREMDKPLIVLDLSSVMSSFLGKTGVNLRRVLDYARSRECVLLLDELDSIAKRRDDASEIGELKRLVTVLLQEIDSWPEGGLLLAATNHPDLLDPAVWRRFEMILTFPRPSSVQALAALNEFLAGEEASPALLDMLSAVYANGSFSDIESAVRRARRVAAVRGGTLDEALALESRALLSTMSQRQRLAIALQLASNSGLSQRRAAELTGVSRDTIRKYHQDSSRVETADE